MSAERYEFTITGNRLNVFSGAEIVISHIPDDDTLGLIRQQARDIDKFRADLAAAVAERDDWNGCAMNVLAERDTLRARLAAIDGAPTAGWIYKFPHFGGFVWRHSANEYNGVKPIESLELIARPAKES